MNDFIDNIFKGVDDNIKLDSEQKEVILDESDNLIVIAGAGSGKTTTLAAKVKYLVDIKKIKGEEILIISLTNKAINELKSRINEDFKLNINIYTFHKLAYDLLKSEDIRYKICSNSEMIIKNIIYKDDETSKIIKILRRDKKYRKIDDNYLDSREFLCSISYEIIQMVKILNIDLDTLKVGKKTYKYIEFLKRIINEYNGILKQNLEFDFEDLIIQASRINECNNRYKYIIVDEYQDISLNRLNLLKNLVRLTNAKTIVVGDDFQTIYSFAGSNINLFLNYEKEMNARMLKITRTYRNSQELIDIAGNFVMKNYNQIKKDLYSHKKLDNPIKIYGYRNNFDDVFENIINQIIDEFGTNKNILVLGRYKKDIELIRSKRFNVKNNKIIYLNNRDIKIDFLTIHASKGLGYDNVIIINFSNQYMGFPSNIENLFLKKDILNLDNNEEEERRLFYVALTRTKNRVYIITLIKHESKFIYELYNNKNVTIDYKVKIIKQQKRHKIN